MWRENKFVCLFVWPFETFEQLSLCLQCACSLESLSAPVVVNRKSFGRNRKSWSENHQFRPKAETYRKKLVTEMSSSCHNILKDSCQKKDISAERGVISAEMGPFCRKAKFCQNVSAPTETENFGRKPKLCPFGWPLSARIVNIGSYIRNRQPSWDTVCSIRIYRRYILFLYMYLI